MKNEKFRMIERLCGRLYLKGEKDSIKTDWPVPRIRDLHTKTKTNGR